MAFIDTKNNFSKNSERDVSRQDIRPASYSIKDGLFQINSYTNEYKLKQGNASQTVQFNLDGLKDLIRAEVFIPRRSAS